MSWYHYSRTPIAALYDVKQVAPHMKPRGLWYAAGDSWKVSSADWNDANAFDYRYQVIISPEARILTINTQEEAEELARRIGVFNTVDQSFIRMRWVDLVRDYDGLHLGIEYGPSNWRSVAQWHYAFDVIGGCVWNTDAITLIDCKTGEAVTHRGVDLRESGKISVKENWPLSRCLSEFFPSGSVSFKWSQKEVGWIDLVDGGAPQTVEIKSASINAGGSFGEITR